MSDGEYFGEIAMLQNQKRMATAKAMTAATLLVIKGAFQKRGHF